MKSILSFDHYDVLETVYKFNPFEDEDDLELIPNFNLVIKYQNQLKKEAALIFSVEIGDEKLEETPFYINAVIIGIFSLEINKDEKNVEQLIEDMYKKNAVAILYPYIRSLVSDLSSKGSKPPLTLPPINIAAMMEEENLVTEVYND